MSDFRSSYRDDQNSRSNSNSNSNKRDEPPMSRLFIIGNKENTEDELRDAFCRFGEIEDVWVVKDKKTGDNKGIAYVKFAKTSEAAQAQEEMNGKRIGKLERPVKVIVAANKSQGRTDNEPDRYVRLFIVVPKNATEEDIRAEFEKYGDVASVSVMQDRQTGTSKGFAYVRYDRFYHAALAFENCPGKYKAVFAEPKLSRNRDSGRDGRDGHRDESFNRYNDWGNGSSSNSQINNSSSEMATFLKMQNSVDQMTTTLDVICSSSVNQDQLWRLFDIVPGLDYCQITREDGPRTNEATVAYNTPEAAIYAKEKIHGLEYPVGERMIVKFSVINPRLDNSMMDVPNSRSERNHNAICSVNLPPAAPMASPDAQVARRLFIVLSSSIPQAILKNVFSCFGSLIDVYLLPNRNCGYVKYARDESAQNAIDTLNGVEICSSKIKVMDAEEPSENNRKRVRRV
ncbi:RNA-binding protein 45 [Eupeodes corollae]|uniref:RNA-binding protein 45 n=1 Tax=Eupeodes corollae TaxID=290404 RepID=UPI0024903BD3|nr:RNA-binding protein 45 [Eupeodes corollae]XP_055911312.1 RNA-binding protein 45 [Eupeodes corollae]